LTLKPDERRTSDASLPCPGRDVFRPTYVANDALYRYNDASMTLSARAHLLLNVTLMTLVTLFYPTVPHTGVVQ
jgi:hypothetical protein